MKILSYCTFLLGTVGIGLGCYLQFIFVPEYKSNEGEIAVLHAQDQLVNPDPRYVYEELDKNEVFIETESGDFFMAYVLEDTPGGVLLNTKKKGQVFIEKDDLKQMISRKDYTSNNANNELSSEKKDLSIMTIILMILTLLLGIYPIIKKDRIAIIGVSFIIFPLMVLLLNATSVSWF